MVEAGDANSMLCFWTLQPEESSQGMGDQQKVEFFP